MQRPRRWLWNRWMLTVALAAAMLCVWPRLWPGLLKEPGAASASPAETTLDGPVPQAIQRRARSIVARSEPLTPAEIPESSNRVVQATALERTAPRSVVSRPEVNDQQPVLSPHEMPISASRPDDDRLIADALVHARQDVDPAIRQLAERIADERGNRARDKRSRQGPAALPQ